MPGAFKNDRGDLEDLLATAEDLASMGSWRLDLRSQEAVWSQGLYRIHGYRPGAFEPGIDSYLELIHPEDRKRAERVLATVVDDPSGIPAEGITVEYRVVCADGAIRDVRARGRIERDASGNAARWIGIAQDVTDQRLTERELLAHYAVQQALRDWESFEEGVVGLLRRIGTALDFAVGGLWTWRGEPGILSLRAFWSAPGTQGPVRELEIAARRLELRPGEALTGRAFQEERPVVVEDVTANRQYVLREFATELGLRTGLAFPAMGDAGPIAVLSYYTSDRRRPSERLVRTLTGIGRELGRFLERRQADLGGRPLSDRELEVLQLAAGGNTGPQIAEQLVVSPETVKTHFAHIYEKLGVSDRAGAVALALRTGLIR